MYTPDVVQATQNAGRSTSDRETRPAPGFYRHAFRTDLGLADIFGAFAGPPARKQVTLTVEPLEFSRPQWDAPSRTTARFDAPDLDAYDLDVPEMVASPIREVFPVEEVHDYVAPTKLSNDPELFDQLLAEIRALENLLTDEPTPQAAAPSDNPGEGMDMQWLEDFSWAGQDADPAQINTIQEAVLEDQDDDEMAEDQVLVELMALLEQALLAEKTQFAH
ncbi:MAG: hypothetical protein LBE83_01020 [Propionibacteriaceae bacterium]|jgi:hypothetical protein|nr:hypothetical protein [Propionibacteriaceae bacterium]